MIRPAAPALRRFIAIVLLYALPGPLIGTATASLFFVLSGAPSSQAGTAGSTLALLIHALPLGLAIGALPAAALGTIIAWRDRRGTSSALRTVLLWSLAPWLLLATPVALITNTTTAAALWVTALLLACLSGSACSTLLMQAVLNKGSRTH